MLNASYGGQAAGQNAAESSRKIFVGGLSHETSEADFNAYFGLYGQVVDCVIMCDPHTRKPRGFGFVTYDSTAAVDRACVNKFHELNGKRVEVKRAIPQDRMAAEDAASKMTDPNVLAALSAGFLSGLQSSNANGMHAGAGLHSNLPGAHLLAEAMRFQQNMAAGQLASQLAGANHGPGAPGAGPNAFGGGGHESSVALDAALSTANSVLAPSMAEPPPETQKAVQGQVPANILNAFKNSGDSNFALPSGIRTGYAEDAKSGGGGGGGAPNGTQGAANGGDEEGAGGQAAQAAQQQQLQSTLLQFQQQQMLLQQMQQRQRQQQQLEQLEQLQALQQTLLTSKPNGQPGANPANMPLPAGFQPPQGGGSNGAPQGSGTPPPAGAEPAAGGNNTNALEQQLRMLNVGGDAAQPPSSGQALPGFEPASGFNPSQFLS